MIRRSFPLFTALLFSAVLVSGCRSHRQAIKPLTAPPPPVRAAEVRIAPPSDFVAAKPSDDLASDPNAATAIADDKGWLRDAFFDFNSSVLTPAAQENLTDSAQWLRQHPAFHVMIEGHCDERGTERYNLALGDHRAYEAKEYLETLGFSDKDIATISYGKDKPFDPSHDEAAWAKNRRAHLVLTAAK